MEVKQTETWSMTLTNNKKLEAAHRKWLRRILGITWKQRITNEEVGLSQRTGTVKLEEILRINRLKWLGHVTSTYNGKQATCLCQTASFTPHYVA